MTAAFGPLNAALRVAAAGNVRAISPLALWGDLRLTAGNFQAGPFTHSLTGDFAMTGAASFQHQGSTLSLQGRGPPRPLPRPACSRSTGSSSRAFLRRTSRAPAALDIAVLTDSVAGSTVAFAAGSSYAISDLQIHGGSGASG